jgi:hypothetical protein
MKKSQNVPVWFRNMALAQHYCIVWGGWYKAQQECSHVEKGVLNMI